MSVYVVNAATFGLSEYNGWTPTGLAEHEGSTYVAQTAALLENVGSDDAGTDISTVLFSGRLDLGAPLHFKHVSRVYTTLGMEAAASVTLYPVARGGETTLGPYTVKTASTSEAVNRTTRTPRGPIGETWRVKLENVSGGAFDLRSLVLNAERGRMVL